MQLYVNGFSEYFDSLDQTGFFIVATLTSLIAGRSIHFPQVADLWSSPDRGRQIL